MNLKFLLYNLTPTSVISYLEFDAFNVQFDPCRYNFILRIWSIWPLTSIILYIEFEAFIVQFDS